MTATLAHVVEFTMTVPGVDPSESTVRFEIAPDGAGARLTLIQSGITDEMVEMGKHGWGSTLGRLERLLVREPAAWPGPPPASLSPSG